MEAFVKFLLDYYIWILAVLGIVIVTIIGFLVDSKQKRKKKESEKESLTNTVKSLENTPVTNNLNNVGVVNETNKVVSTPRGNETETLSSNNYNLDFNNQIPIQNSVGLPNQTDTSSNIGDVSLSEQKPHFAPREVNIPVPQQQGTPNSYTQVIAPQPVKAVSINQPIQEPVYTQTNYANNAYQNLAPNPVANNQQVVQNGIAGNGANVQPIYQNVANSQTQVQPLNNGMTQISNNNITNSTENVQTVNSNIHNPVSQTQTLPNNINNGMRFVTGIQEQSNSEDMWKL